MAGAKKKRQGQPRQNVLRVRLTAKERAILDQAAETKTLDTSTWARSELLAFAKKILEEASQNG